MITAEDASDQGDASGGHGLPTGGIYRRYALYIAGLLSLCLVASGAVGMLFSYRDMRALVDELQREKARAAAQRIEQFLGDTARQLRGVLQRSPRTQAGDEIFYAEMTRLLRTAPSVSDAAWLDVHGHERVRVSRVGRDHTAADIDRAHEPGVRAARSTGTWFGNIEFRRDSVPHVAVAVSVPDPQAGIVMADVDLRFVAEVVAAIRIGATGHAYVVDASGRLISHPDAGRVLSNTDLADRPQVRAALAPTVFPPQAAPTVVAQDASGLRTLTAHATISGPGWHVLVEQPLAEALAPLRHSLTRALLLLCAGIVVAAVAGVLLARRLIAPIRTLEHGASRIGEGHLEHRVEIGTGDELQALAGRFNRMAERLRASYASLERKVEERTSELARANRDKARFLAAASHDLRQPVHALGLFVAHLRESRDEATRARLVDRIEASTTAVSELIEALLDISRLDAGTVEVRTIDFPLQPLFDRIEQAFGTTASARGLRLRVRASRLRVRTDPVLLERILLNLCANAIRYTRQGGAIVAARHRRGRVRIEVWDTGIGIAAQEQTRIFEEFHQSGEPSPGESKGLGLGLAIVDRLSRLLGLPVSLTSTPGRGSVFAVEVPCADAARFARPASPQPDVSGQLSGLTVLVIDDDATAREAVTGLLAQWGCSVLSATDEAQALAQLRAAVPAPRLVICDYRLAGGRLGTDVLRSILAAAKVEIPGVIVTADTGLDSTALSAATGFPVLHKPVNAARLRAFLIHVTRSSTPPLRDPAPRRHEAPG